MSKTQVIGIRFTEDEIRRIDEQVKVIAETLSTKIGPSKYGISRSDLIKAGLWLGFDCLEDESIHPLIRSLKLAAWEKK